MQKWKVEQEKATVGVLKEFLKKYGKDLDVEKEEARLGKMFRESAISIIEDYGLPLTVDEYAAEIMPFYIERWPQAKALPGADRLIKHLHKLGIPLALASNSVRKNIDTKISYQQDWKASFTVILGGDEVEHGKPSPDIFLEAARKMGINASHCLVIEDSLVGVAAAKAAGMKVVAVPSLHSQAHRYSIADYVLHNLLEFQPELFGLPAFEDWVQDGLPIEPVFIKGLASDGGEYKGTTLLNLSLDKDSSASLPDQVWGMYFGLAKLEMNKIFKAVVSFGWDLSSGTTKQTILLTLVGESNEKLFQEPLLLLIVGYIRKLKYEVVDITEEDMNIAEAALDLFIFTHHKSNPLLEESSSEE
ncbi:hypothetical protein QJS04_geneDACA006218 [Acorus gramineus]|uniref:Riboflavin kinase n=1 Tax=Acorus gramineus TaxID=55184 RepID=A0AAV9AU65_ACOGR|nr:hypothetical protein QJS04_geneDACA006218 [Acorus gramineus]